MKNTEQLVEFRMSMYNILGKEYEILHYLNNNKSNLKHEDLVNLVTNLIKESEQYIDTPLSFIAS